MFLDALYINDQFNVLLFAGDEVQVVYRSGDDTTPLQESTTYYYHGFTGFRI